MAEASSLSHRRPPPNTGSDLAGANDLNDPPPAYEATPSTNTETTLEYGPLRPFQPVSHVLPQSQHCTSPYSTHAQTGQSPSTLPPPSFPFWNGASLTPTQTGFSDGPMHGPHPTFGSQQSPFELHGHHSPYQMQQGMSAYSPSHTLPQSSLSPQPRPQQSPVSSPPPQNPKYSPSEVPIPGQPYLRNQMLLVYPVGDLCWKCQNTGYKQNDPSHPCRKCWDKHGKPYKGSLKFAAETTWPPSPNYQRPLPDFNAPAHQPVPGGYPASVRPAPPPSNYRYRFPPPHLGANVLILRPGDPRMGGHLCYQCGGSGQVLMGVFLLEQEMCQICRGAGRVF